MEQKKAPGGTSRTASDRKPSGFGSIGQRKGSSGVNASKLSQPSSGGNETPKGNSKERHAHKEAKVFREKRSSEDASKRRKRLTILLAVLLGAVILYVILALAFGGKDTYHQLPVIEREGAESVEPTQQPGEDDV